jgi:5-methylcytosine-specific restriction endonuclease McrA
MDATKREFVRSRAGGRCEYFRRQEHSDLRHHIEHIIARQHGGCDDAENLALACHRCNLHKGTNLTGLDPQTGELTPLFHPRRDQWQDHFAFEGHALPL